MYNPVHQSFCGCKLLLVFTLWFSSLRLYRMKVLHSLLPSQYQQFFFSGTWRTSHERTRFLKAIEFSQNIRNYHVLASTKGLAL